jgi:hypothetical protein
MLDWCLHAHRITAAFFRRAADLPWLRDIGTGWNVVVASATPSGAVSVNRRSWAGSIAPAQLASPREEVAVLDPLPLAEGVNGQAACLVGSDDPPPEYLLGHGWDGGGALPAWWISLVGSGRVKEIVPVRAGWGSLAAYRLPSVA